MEKILIKGIVIGDTCVGKSWMLEKLKHKDLITINTSPTIGVDFFSFEKCIDKKKYKFNIWDTSGDEKFSSIVNSYFTNITVCFICFSLKDKTGLTKLDMLIKKAEYYCNDDAVIALIGTRSDEQNISESFLEETLTKYNYPLYRVGNDYDSISKPVFEIIDNIHKEIKQNKVKSGIIRGIADVSISCDESEEFPFGTSCLNRILSKWMFM